MQKKVISNRIFFHLCLKHSFEETELEIPLAGIHQFPPVTKENVQLNVLFALFAKPEAQTKLKRFKIAEKTSNILYIKIKSN